MINNYVEIGTKKGYIELLDSDKKVKYVHCNKTYKYTDPEEQVRVNYYVELIEKYQYDPRKINLEVIVPRRTPSDLADIVIYEDIEQKKPYIVIECKKDGISDAEFEQAIEQAFGNANSIRGAFNGVVAGNTRRFFDVKNFPANERDKNIIADIPINYGKVQEFRFKKGDENWDIKPVNKEDLIRILEKCNNTLWDGGKMAPIDAFDELSKIIFVKIRDEQIARRKGEPYDFQIKTHETAISVHNRINQLYENAKEIDPEVFTDSIQSLPNKLLTVVNHLQSINLSKTDLDTKGVAFERFMEDFFKGKQGQYFTPREIVSFILSICNINNTSKVLDPACGSGGFLLHALDHIRAVANDYYDEGTADHFKYWHDFAKDNLFGIEVNERIARVAKMNMIIHDDGHTNVICIDALEDFTKIQKINQKFVKNSFDLIITNPPFGASIKKDENPYLSSFEFGKNNQGQTRSSQKTEILFIERCWEFLKEGTGQIAIILPDGILTNTTLKYVRTFLSNKFEIKGIFSLPQVTFAHYGAGLKSSILLLRKRSLSEEKLDNEVFCAIINKVGYDATGRKDKNELHEISKKYQQFLKGKNFYESNIYIKPISKLNNNRLDSYYYSPMFEDIISEIKKSKHPLLRLDKVCTEIYNGSTPAKDDYSESISDPKIVKVASLKKGKVNLNLVENVKPEAVSSKKIQDGDILILSSAHQAEYLGKNPCIVEIPEDLKDEDIAFVGELINIRADQTKINPYYLLQLLNTKNYFLLINREKRGQTSHLYPKDMGSILIPVPKDMTEQNKNAEKYKQQYKKYEDLIAKAEEIIQETINDFEKVFL
ncbi:MAG TPA: N-6 DNA methylase [Salinivirgaceae bacterium]|nr:N-6 DNA methylase [Salinivirgaceae bacterium]